MNRNYKIALILLLALILLGLAACGDQGADGAPSAVDDSVTTYEDQPVEIAVLDNDSPKDTGDLTLTIVASPEHGGAEVLESGAIRYTPASEYSGRDAFRYMIRDRLGRSDTAKVSIAISAVNDAPVVTSLRAIDSEGNDLSSGLAPFKANISWTVSDADGDPLSCELAFGDGEKIDVDCSGGLLSHEYRKVGRYNTVLTVSDGVNSTSQKIVVEAATDFNITLHFETDLTDSQREAFEWAVKRWSEVIVGDVGDVAGFNIDAGDCGNAEAGSYDIDDLLIFVNVAYEDGEGGVLGFGGPCYIRNSNNLPFMGRISFDSADLESLEEDGLLNSVILHEMGHVLGIGTIWEMDGLLDWDDGVDSCADADSIFFIGNSASQEWQDTFLQAGNPPVENSGGAGTKCGHWLETKFDNELMTGWLNGNSQPLSRVTAASLEDLGYRIDIYGADEYVLPNNLVAPQGTPGILLKERLIYPKVAPDVQ